MTETEAQSIEFKSPIAKWNDAIFLGSFFFFTFITIGLLGLRIHYLYPLLIPLFGIATYYAACYLTMAFTTITITDKEFIITQNSGVLNKNLEVNIALNNVRGFEIGDVTRGSRALIIYTNSFQYYKYSLSKTAYETILKEYLSKHIQLLDKTSNPLFSSFGSAYWFVFKRALVFLFFSFTTFATLYWLNNIYLLQFINGKYLTFFSFLISLFYWWFFIRRTVKLHQFRFGAFYWGSNFFFYFSTCLFLPIQYNLNKIKEVPVTLNHSFEVLIAQHTKLFTIRQVNYEPNSILLSNYIIKSRSGRSNLYPIDHQFATPIGSGDTIKKNGVYNLWLVKTYTQNTKKTADFYEKITGFHQQYEAVFNYSFKQKPVFYKLVEDDDMNRLVKRSYNASSQSNILLEPHWETLASYKNNIQREIMLFILTMICFNLVGCIIIAINR